jgi:RNA polymerase-interacting CarD/CdnL/TRCF family regulator
MKVCSKPSARTRQHPTNHTPVPPSSSLGCRAVDFQQHFRHLTAVAQHSHHHSKHQQSGRDASYNQSPLRTPPSQVISKEQRQAATWRAQAQRQQINKDRTRLAELQYVIDILRQQEKHQHQSHPRQYPYPSFSHEPA